MTEEGLRESLSALDRALGSIGAPWMVIGGIAVIARGVTRHTADVDATIWAEGLDLDRLMETLAREGMEPRIDDAREFARQRQVLLLRHAPSGTELEISLAWLPFEREALASAERMSLRGERVPVARVEDLVVYKAVAWRDRDRADISRLLESHGDSIDLERVRRIVREFAEALEEPDRIPEFEALAERALRGR